MLLFTSVNYAQEVEKVNLLIGNLRCPKCGNENIIHYDNDRVIRIKGDL